MDAQYLDHGAPDFLKEILDNHADAINANKPVAGMGTTVTESECGTAVNVGNEGGAASSAGDTETITGAVNGVPATLNVKTDGAAWLEI